MLNSSNKRGQSGRKSSVSRRSRRQGRGISASRANNQFYKGKLTMTDSQLSARARKKDYRRQRLSDLKRRQLVVGVKRVVFFAVWGLIGLFVLTRLQVRSFSYTGSELTEVQIEQLNDFVGDYTGFKPLFDERKFILDLEESIAFVADAQVSLGIFSTSATVAIESKQPILLYQRNVGQTLGALAQDGTLIEVDSLNTSVTTVLLDNTGVGSDLGQQVVSPRQVLFFDQLAEQFEENGERITQFEITDQPREIQLRLKDRSYSLLTSQDRSSISVVDDFVALRDSGVSVEQYVDLRVVDKVFYR